MPPRRTPRATVGVVEPPPAAAGTVGCRRRPRRAGSTVRVAQIEPGGRGGRDRLPRRHSHPRAATSGTSRRCHTSTMTMLQRFVNVDHVDREALVVIAGGDIVGLGQYERLRTQPADAEVAFSVADRLHGQGIGTLLLEHLASLARQRGSSASSPRPWRATTTCSMCSPAPGSRCTVGSTTGCTSCSFGDRPDVGIRAPAGGTRAPGDGCVDPPAAAPGSIAVDDGDGSIRVGSSPGGSRARSLLPARSRTAPTSSC